MRLRLALLERRLASLPSVRGIALRRKADAWLKDREPPSHSLRPSARFYKWPRDKVVTYCARASTWLPGRNDPVPDDALVSVNRNKA